MVGWWELRRQGPTSTCTCTALYVNNSTFYVLVGLLPSGVSTYVRGLSALEHIQSTVLVPSTEYDMYAKCHT